MANIFSGDYNSPQELRYIQEACEYAELAHDTVGVWYYKGRLADSYYNNDQLDISDSLYETFLNGAILDTSIYVDNITAYAKSLIYRDEIK